jgi:hypothetical protein
MRKNEIPEEFAPEEISVEDEETYGKLYDLLVTWGPDRLQREIARGVEALELAGNRKGAPR